MAVFVKNRPKLAKNGKFPPKLAETAQNSPKLPQTTLPGPPEVSISPIFPLFPKKPFFGPLFQFSARNSTSWRKTPKNGQKPLFRLKTGQKKLSFIESLTLSMAFMHKRAKNGLVRG